MADLVSAASRRSHSPDRRLLAIGAVVFVTFVDTTIVTVALAGIQVRLHAGVSSLQWVLDAYALVFASCMLLGGLLGDRLGRRRVMVSGLLVFASGALLGALAPDVTVLIAARAIMGLGAAASEPGTLSMIRQVYPGAAERSRALGAWAAMSGLAIATGPIAGGILVGVAGWRAVFWFSLAAASLAAAAALLVLPESSDPSPGRIDVAGALAAAVALVALTYALIEGENAGYSSARILVLFALAAAGAGAFVLVEGRRRRPMVDLAWLRNRRFDGALAVAFAASFGLFAVFFFVALYLQIVEGASPFRMALQFVPMAAAIVAGAVIAGRWVARSGPSSPMSSGCLLGGAGILLCDPALHAGGSAALAATLALAGFGIGTALVPATAVALGEVPAVHSGVAASSANTSRQLGAVTAVAVLGALMNAHLTSDLARRLGQIGVPSAFQGIVVSAVEHGGLPNSDPSATAQFGPLVARVISTAYGAFRSGVLEALLIAGVMLVALAPIAALLLRRRDRAS